MNQSNRVVSRWFRSCLLAGLLMSLALFGCRNRQAAVTSESGSSTSGDSAAAGSTGQEAGGAEAELPVIATVPSFSLTDQRGRTITLDDLRGKVWIVDFIFTRCTSTCPKQTEQLANLQHTFARQQVWPELQLVSISVDPEHDVPDVLLGYAERAGADHDKWLFLTGTREATWALSTDGFKLPVGDNPTDTGMPLFHSTQFVLVDRAGRIRGYYDGLDAQRVKALIDDAVRLTSEPYDPAAAREATGALPATSDAPEPAGQGGDGTGSEALAVGGTSGTDEPDSASLAAEPQAGSDEDQPPSLLDDLELPEDIFSDTGTQPATEPPAGEQPSSAAAVREPERLYVPSRALVEPDWIRLRGAKQRAAILKSDVFHDFQFQDRQPESGINWVHQIVDDAGRSYKAAHYDHGNGVTVADVNGDGHDDLYFTSQLGPNGLFLNQGSGQFLEATQSAGVGLEDRISVTASFADADNDGDSDLFVTTVRGGNVLFENLGDGTFRDVTEQAGVGYVGHSSGAIFFDYDRDGWLDLFVTNVGKYTTEEVGPGNYYIARTDAFAGHLKPELTETSILYHNQGGLKFQDVTSEVGLEDGSWSGDATPLDANHDGWPDLYILNMQGHDEYYENQQGKRFVKRSRELFPKTPWGSMGIKVFDFDNDGRQDIYITDMHSDMSERIDIDQEKRKARMQWPESMLQSGGMSIYGNAFFHQLADGSYEEISDRNGSENYWPWGLSTGDLNADGFEDAFVASSMNLPYRYGVNSVLLNDAGREFVDSEFVLGVEPRRDGRTSKFWFQLDADGPDRDHSYLEQAGIHSGKVDVWGALGSRSSVIFDLDEDGDLDIVTNDFHSEPMVLISDLADGHTVHFLKIALQGTESNRDALGAVVRVRVGDKVYEKIHDGKSGYLSQSSMKLYFGLADAEEVDSVEVVWPSGKVQQVDGPIAANSTLRIQEE